MTFTTKYGIGELVYVVYHTHEGIQIELDKVIEICVSEDAPIYFTENSGDEVHESQIYSLDEFDKIKYELIKERDDDCT